MPVIHYGYNGATTALDTFETLPMWRHLHPEMRRRTMAAIVASGHVLGVGSTFRTAASQIQVFTQRHTRTTKPTSIRWDGSYWVLKSGNAPAAIPGESYHEPCIGPDGRPDDSDATGLCVAVDTLFLVESGLDGHLAQFGLRNFTGEAWHIQPIEWPARRRDWNAQPELLQHWPLPGDTPPPTEPPPAPMEDDMPRLIQPADDAAVFLLDGLTVTWVRDGNVLAAVMPLVTPGTTTVDRLALKAMELHGPAPAYGATPPNQPGRTVAADFAVHRP